MPRSRIVTTVTFEKLLARLAPDRERAAEEYETLRRRLTKYFDLKGLGSPDSAADETLDRMALKIEAGEDVRDFIHYAFGVAHWVYLERFRAEDRERSAYADLTQMRKVNYEHLAAPYLETLENCLDKLATEDRQLLRTYYTDAAGVELAQQRINLAQSRDLTLNSLRLRVFRLRQALERCLRDES
jgi:hypothetical protein